MRGFYEHIKAKIQSELTIYRTIELFNSQDEALLQKQIEVVTFPAVFVDFEFVEVRQLAFGIKDMDIIVRFRFMFENYTYTSRLDDLDKMTTFTSVFDMWRGIEGDPYQFTSFHEVLRGLDKDHDMMAFPFIEYATTYRNQENFTGGTTVVDPVDESITVELLL
jgi:hypothetical protein